MIWGSTASGAAEVSGVHESDGLTSCALSAITKGAVFWYENRDAK